MKRYGVLFVLVSMAASVCAQSESLDEIVVTATRQPVLASDIAAALSVLERNEWELRRAGLGIDESLQTLPGLYTQNRQNFAQDLRISVRGFGARSSFGIRGVTLLLDGVPVSLPDGQGQVDLIDPADIARVEVLRGASGLLYGNGAGGVINFVSQDFSEPATVSAAFGSDGLRRLQIGLAGGTQDLNFALRAGTLVSEGYRDHSNTEQHRLRGILNWQPSADTEVSVNLIATDQPIAEDPGGVTAELAASDPRAARDRNILFAADESQDQLRLQVSANHQLGANGELVVNGYFQDQSFANHLPFEGGGAVEFSRRHAGASLLWRSRETSSHGGRWLAGLEIGGQRDDRLRFDNLIGALGELRLAQAERVHTAGLFGQREFKVTDAVSVTAGVRYDRLQFDIDDNFPADGIDSGRRNLSEWSPRLSLSYRPNSTAHWFLNYATSYESPTLTEFSNPAGGGFNPGLEPATTRSLEIGWRRSWADLELELVAFDIKVRDELIGFELATQPGRTFFRNAGRTGRHGLEAALRGELTDSLNFRFGYAYSDFEFDEFQIDGSNFSGNDAPGQPRHRGALVLNWSGAGPIDWSLDIEHTGARYANNANTVRIGSHTLINLRGGLILDRAGSQWSVFAGLNNVADRRYTDNLRINAFGGRFFEPGPGRHYYLGLRWFLKD